MRIRTGAGTAFVAGVLLTLAFGASSVSALTTDTGVSASESAVVVPRVPTSVLGEEITRAPAAASQAPAQVLGETVSNTSGGLPVTGADIAGTLVIGAVLVGLGVVTIAARRRQDA